MALSPWGSYFADNSAEGSPNEKIYSLSPASQARIYARRAYETENWEYFISADGSIETAKLSQLSAEQIASIQKHILQQPDEDEALRTPQPERTKADFEPFQPFHQQFPPGAQMAPNRWTEELALHQAKLDLEAKARRLVQKEELEFYKLKLQMEGEVKIQKESARRTRQAIMTAVPVFDRQRTKAFLDDWAHKFRQALATDYSLSTETERIDYLKRQSSADANSWYQGLTSVPADVTVEWYIRTILHEHMPANDELTARKALRSLRLHTYGTAPDSFDRFTADFDNLLPRCPLMDTLSVVEIFHSTIGDAFFLDIARHINKDVLLYSEHKEIGRTLWAKGARPPSTRPTPKPTPTEESLTNDKASRFKGQPKEVRAKFNELMTHAVQVSRVDMSQWNAKQKELYRMKLCFHSAGIGETNRKKQSLF